MRRLRAAALGSAAALLATLANASVGAEPAFVVSIDPAVRQEPYTGRLYVALAPAGSRQEPRSAMHGWFSPPPVFAIDVEGLAPGAPARLDSSALAHPVALDQLEAGEYRIQAIARINPDSPKAGLGAGDLISPVVTARLDPEAGFSIDLVLSEVVPEREFRETARVRLFEVESRLLSTFHGRLCTMRAGVVLPEGFNADAATTYPVVYWIGGFGGDHFSAHGLPRWLAAAPEAQQAIWVVPDPSCYRGHSVFADSANNGPWGAALVHELIPALEAAYRGAGAEQRYVSGVSSGGWSSLWLQLNYPDEFAGCWSHVPDPVELHHFQTVDVYGGDNMYADEDGAERPIARRGGQVMLTARDFVARETVLGPGGQIHSFEAVWSPRLPGGEPRPLFNRETGAIDPVTAEAWRDYDIAHLVRARWDAIGPKVRGKIHVYAGGEDTFYLELAIPALQEAFAEVGSDAVVEIIDGMPHMLHGPGHEDMLQAIVTRRDQLRAQ
ncbi:MAG: alpha/beta hydrolase-fold protein [Phycisphaerales bacterium JB039]